MAITAAQGGTVEDCVAYTGPLSTNLHQSLIYPRSSSSMVGDIENYSSTAKTSTLLNMANNTSQGALDVRISMGRSGLYLTDDSDLGGRTCETFRPSPIFHLWTGDDVAGYGYKELIYPNYLEFSL